VGLLLDTALWIVKGFRDTTYYIVIIFQRIQYLVRSFSVRGEYVAFLSFFFAFMCHMCKQIYLLHRFRMRRHLFICIMNVVEEHNDYFVLKRNAAGNLGLFCAVAFRMIAYGVLLRMTTCVWV
jgi:hypothetical protein